MDLSHAFLQTRTNDWRQIPAPAVDEWILAADLGQSNDPTALCAMHHRVVPLDEWTPDAKAETWRQERREHFDVRGLRRLPLGLSYVEQVAQIGAALNASPLDGRAVFVIDETGVGRPVGDLFDAAGLRPNRITITSGLEIGRMPPRTWHVPKSYLVAGLEARLHTREFQIAEMRETEVLLGEMKDFKRKVSETGRITWNARVGAHDDLILACAMAVFMATNRHTSSVGPLVI